MNYTRWRVALRIARRDAWRHKGRSLLVVALVGLPILALGAADIAYRTWQLDPGERLTRGIGAADAGVQWVGGHVQQAPSGFLNYDWTSTGSDPTATTPPTSRLRAQLPAGSRIIERRDDLAGTRVRTPSGVEYADLTGLDYIDPIAAGLVRPVRGNAPNAGGEAAVTTTLAKALHVDVGGTITLLDTGRTLHVTAVVADPGYRRAETVYVPPADMPTAQSPLAGPNLPAAPGALTWLVSSPTPISWQQVRRLNQLGYVVVSRQVYLHPPPSSQVSWRHNGGVSGATLSLVTLVAGMALFEVVLLAGPAFAVSARRQRRQLALVASAGGRPADLRNVVLAGGLVLGLTAGAAGAALGIVAAAAGVPTLGTLVDQVPGHLDIRPAELTGLAAVAVFTALAAALFPARSAARTDVVAALAGRRGTVRTRKRTLAAGLVLGALGTVVAIGGATTSAHGATVILAGVALIELGLITCTPGLIGLVGRTGRHLPLAPRIALRDAGRNRSAATPAVAAVMASVIGAIAASLIVASSEDQSRREYRPTLPMNAAWVGLDSTAPRAEAGASRAALRSTLPVAQMATVRGPANSCPLADGQCPSSEINFAHTQWMMRHPSHFQGSYLPSTVIDDGTDLSTLFGVPEPAAAAALRAGKVVVVDEAAVSAAGTVTLDGIHTVPGSAGAAAKVTSHRVTVGAVAVSAGYPATQLIVPPSVAARLGVVPTALGVFARDRRRPTGAEQRRARGKLAAIDPSSYLYVETGYHDDRAWMKYALVGVAAVIAVGAAVIATALADVDGRTDLVTLGAVGADPRTRRVLSLSRAAVIAGIGAALGTAAGFVPAIAWVRASRVPAVGTAEYPGAVLGAQLHLVVPWSALAAALIGIPLLAAVVAGAFSRSRLPSERPAD